MRPEIWEIEEYITGRLNLNHVLSLYLALYWLYLQSRWLRIVLNSIAQVMNIINISVAEWHCMPLVLVKSTVTNFSSKITFDTGQP